MESALSVRLRERWPSYRESNERSEKRKIGLRFTEVSEVRVR